MQPYTFRLWGFIRNTKATIKWHDPNADDLVCKVEISEKDWQRIAQRIFPGKKVVGTIPIKMNNGDNGDKLKCRV